ncbi:MAG: sigma 54-interacting transcriptional regulator [Phycisphaerae bacterium]|nr:sigma 54-interacting transcriptional regulator [Phycisphaerae bacterium]
MSERPSNKTQRKSQESVRKLFAKRYRDGLEGLYGISQILAAGTSQKEILIEVLEVMDREIGLHRGTIMLLSPDGRELMTEVAHKRTARQLESVRYQFGEGVVGQVVQTGRSALVPKVSEEPTFLDRIHRRSKKDSEQEISFICVPISIGNKVFGALSADRVYDPAVPLDELERVLSIIAGMIANDVRTRRHAAIERQNLEEENLRLREQLEDRFRPENIIGNSGAMREIYRSIHQVAPSDATVIIRGESGTGKELVAHAIHYSSPRAKGPFIKINCAALSENLIESELFGHEKGAFTGAIQTRSGRIEEAEGGTLFLDEIGDFSPATQVKMLRVLQEREFERVGSNRTRKANVRIICATHRDLEQSVEAGQFRQDLYYRVLVFPITMPPLRDRKDDIMLLADFFVERYSRRMKKNIRRITTTAINMMVIYHWPGNVRELENCIERAVLLSSDGVIHGYHLPPSLQTSEATDTVGSGTLQERLSLFERDIVVDSLKRTGGNISSSAHDLGTTARILGYRIRQLEIDYRRYRSAKK